MKTINLPVTVTFELAPYVEDANGWHILFIDARYTTPFLQADGWLHIMYRKFNPENSVEELDKFVEEVMADVKDVDSIKSVVKTMMHDQLLADYEAAKELKDEKVKALADAVKDVTHKFDIQFELDVE